MFVYYCHKYLLSSLLFNHFNVARSFSKCTFHVHRQQSVAVPLPTLPRPLSWSIGLSRKYSVLFVDISALPCPPNHVYSSDRSADDNPARMKCTCHMPPHATTGLSPCDDVFIQPLSTLLRFNFSLQHRSNCRRGSGRECGKGERSWRRLQQRTNERTLNR